VRRLARVLEDGQHAAQRQQRARQRRRAALRPIAGDARFQRGVKRVQADVVLGRAQPLGRRPPGHVELRAREQRAQAAASTAGPSVLPSDASPPACDSPEPRLGS
jgi:hypothetical protein